jgi:hypothetical protein
MEIMYFNPKIIISWTKIMWINRQDQNLPDKMRLIYLHAFNTTISFNNSGCIATFTIFGCSSYDDQPVTVLLQLCEINKNNLTYLHVTQSLVTS